MAQTYNEPLSPDQDWIESLLDIDENFAAYKSSFSGTSAPTSPVEGQHWRDTAISVWKGYNGSSWDTFSVSGTPSSPTVTITTVTGIDGTATGTTTLLTATADTIIDKVVLRVTAIDTLTVNPAWGCGVAAGEDDVVTPVDFSIFTDLSTVGQTMELRASAISRVVTSSQVLKLGIDTAATALTLTLTAIVWGTILP